MWWRAAASAGSLRSRWVASKAGAKAKHYADKLQLRFTYASNGHGVYAIDRTTGEEGETAGFPTPQELWARAFAEENAWRDRFAAETGIQQPRKR